MANAAIYITWGNAFQGRETKSLEVFGQVLELHARWKKEGKIADHRTYLATTGDYERFGGCILVEGEVPQLRALLDTDEWKIMELRARNVVHNVQVVHCVGGNEVPKVIELLGTARKQVGITT
jgi:hypothetical protein